MKKKVDRNFIIEYRDVDPYTGHLDEEGETCRTATEEGAKDIIAALLDYNANSRHGRPNRQYTIKEIVDQNSEEERHWWQL